ncbi:PaaI family thioesterase [Aquipseudomonas ullengensis]|uniref:PaaI family thioesterase n=1 Tax=Aquipseudomonas ullengensis TaxID=2759166 RepID=A0A7W4QBX5_9GAMM|nr:PaaI family thioesterase [Pseudomonas ullengensis]MBB2497099.1 PaaI family thioesterase [Pseudomonas ullengensis]
MAVDGVPAGFSRLASKGEFLRRCGEFYLHDELPIMGVRIGPEHLNALQIVHGGLLATLADSACGAMIWRQSGGQLWPVTVNLNVDYLSAVRAGEWLEAHVEVHKTGGRFNNASCLLQVGTRVVLRGNGIFTRWKEPA